MKHSVIETEMEIQFNETTEMEIANNLFDSIKPGIDKTGALQ